MRRPSNPWAAIAVACAVLALTSLLFNITTRAELAGHWQSYSAVRKTITKVLNSGTAWASIAFYAGWRLVALGVAGTLWLLSKARTRLVPATSVVTGTSRATN